MTTSSAIKKGESSSRATSSVFSDDRIKNIFRKGKIPNTFKGTITLESVPKLESVLTEFLKEVRFHNVEEALEAIDKISRVLPLDSIRGCIVKKFPDQREAFLTAKAMFNKAKFYLNHAEGRVKPATTRHLTALIDSLLSVLESLFNVFGVEDLFKPAENQMEAQFKMGKVMMLASLFMMLSGTILPLFGVETGGLIVGGTMITLALGSVCYKKCGPKVRKLPHAVDLTKEIEAGRLPTVGGRKDVVKKIATVFSSCNNRMPCHVMLLGASGVGKTQTVHAFAQALKTSRDPEFAKLKGKKVFYINTADIINARDFVSGGNKILKQISDAMEANREGIILVFDEIALACQTREESAIGDQLKKYLDPQNPDKFPLVIGMTTLMEYTRDIYGKNPAMGRRFQTILIDNTKEGETRQILNMFLCQVAPEISLEKDIIKHLVDETNRIFPQGVQPGAALRILSACVQELRSHKKSLLEMRIEEKQSQLQTLYSEGAVDPLSDTTSSEIDRLKKELQELEPQLVKEKSRVKRIDDLKNQILKLKILTNQSIVKAHGLKESKATRIMKRVLLTRFFLIPVLERKLILLARKITMKVTLDKDLVNSVIRQELENDRRVLDAIEKEEKGLVKKSA